ncbi:MAG: ribose 5-phosphate isomerase B [Candidatus Onthomonas sp.]|nr:ribose 5-phosphate isomerase B [Candidatus Onthomonas sp.]
MKIGFACDHAAVSLKNTLLEYLKGKGYECVDYGVNDPTKRVDYPVMGRKVAEAIKAGEVDKGVLVCGTGVGISMAANKVPGIRAGVCSEPYTARMIVEHNNCQIVAMGARVVGDELAKAIVDAFFGATFAGAHHVNRLNLIAEMEEEYYKPEKL